MQRIFSTVALVVLVACGIKLPPIEIVIEPPSTTNTTPPAPDPTPAPEPAPEPPPPVVEPPAPEPSPLVNLNIVVTGFGGIGIPSAECVISGATERGTPDTRTADGGGVLNFAVRGSVNVGCSAPGYVARAAELPPGNHRFPLAPVAPPDPPKPPPDPVPPLAGVFPQCGVGENTLRISAVCLEAVARSSAFYKGCQAGSRHDCHYYVREVAIALRTAQRDDRWGIVEKKNGENVDGYSEDVVAYLPAPLPLNQKTHLWRGIDIVGGSGLPGARYQAGELHRAIECGTPEADAERWCNRRDMFWAPVPK